MNIRPSAAIRQNDHEIAELCRGTQAPVYLTKNGEGDLVGMNIGSFKITNLRIPHGGNHSTAGNHQCRLSCHGAANGCHL